MSQISVLPAKMGDCCLLVFLSEQYHYGELRLTRLNLYAKVLLGKF